MVIVAVFLAVTPAPVPTSGQAPNHPAGTSSGVQQQRGNSKTPPQPAFPLANQNQPKSPKGNADEQGAKEDGNTVAVSKFPPVSISKDWADWSYWGFGGILVVVSGLQVWL